MLYKEYLKDGLAAVDLLSHRPEDYLELKNGDVLHMIVHYIMDQHRILDIVSALVDAGFRIINLFGQHAGLWEETFLKICKEDIMIINYGCQLNDFTMNAASQIVEEQEFSRRKIRQPYFGFEPREDYLLYDDMGFMRMVQEDLKEFRETCDERRNNRISKVR